MHSRIIYISATLLVVVGVGGYALSGGVSPTALIPSAIGLALLAGNGIQHSVAADGEGAVDVAAQ